MGTHTNMGNTFSCKSLKSPPEYDENYVKKEAEEDYSKDDEFLVQECADPQDQFSFMQQCGRRHCGCSLKPVVFPNVSISPNARTTAVVITIRDSSSYDEMFTTVPQEGMEGTKVVVFETGSEHLGEILKGLRGEPIFPDGDLTSDQEQCQELVRQLVAEVAMVDNDCVVFNWECCGGCGDEGFPAPHRAKALELMAFALGRGSMVMASDFSLKALIKDWDEALLGPNPFVKVGTFSHKMKLEFDASTLAECPSSQLQKVGELCADKGHAVVSAMSDTIAYTVNPAKASHDAYHLRVLTIVTEMSGVNIDSAVPASMRCGIGAKYGSAGHVMLTYPSGGTLLTSAGHWLELVNMDVNMDNLRSAYTKEYGSAVSERMMRDLSIESDSFEVRQGKIQSYAKDLVQKSAPCSKRVSSKYWG